MTEKFTLDKEIIELAKSVATKIEDTKLRKRAYALNIAANAVAKYLDLDTTHSLYKITSFVQNFELADLYIDGVRVDVRVSFNGKSFAIPKVQKKYEAEPCAYIVLQLEKDLASAKILGFIPTEKLGQGKADEEYYLYSTNILTPIENLKDFLATVELNQKIFSANDHEKIKELAASFIDDEISESEKVYFIKHVTNCPVCREVVCELAGFDTVSLQVKNYHELLNDSTLSVLSGNRTEIAEAAVANLATVENAEENFEKEHEEELKITEELEELPIETVETQDDNTETLELNENIETLEVVDEPEALPTLDKNDEEIVLPMGVSSVEHAESETLEIIDTIEEALESSIEFEQEDLPLETLETLETLDMNSDNTEDNVMDEAVELLETIDEPEQSESREGNEEEFILPMGADALETLEEATDETFDIVEEVVTEDDIPALMESEELVEILEESEPLVIDEKIAVLDTETIEETVIEPLETLHEEPLEELETLEEDILLSNDELSLEETQEIEDITDTKEFVEVVEENKETTIEENNEELLVTEEENTLNELKDFESAEEIMQEVSEEPLEEILEEKMEQEETSQFEVQENVVQVSEIEEQHMANEDNESPSSESDNSFEEVSLDELAELSDISDEETESTESEEINELLDDDLRALLSEETASENVEENVQENADPDIDTLYDVAEQDGETAQEGDFTLSQEPVSEKTLSNAKKGLTVAALFILLASAGAAAWFVNNQRNVENDMSMDSANQDEMLNMQDQNLPAQQPAISQDINKSMTNSFSDKPTAITITKLSWQVSEKLALENSVKEYLQTAGKNIQMNLQNDLANSADINFNNIIKVSFEIAQDNTLKGLQILESSGSDQIDDIVARSIKNTLKYVSVPKIESYKSDYFLTLIINF